MSRIRLRTMRRPAGLRHSIRLGLLIVALSKSVEVESAPSVDDPVKAVQEALRKQHMYFGEPSGVVDDETRTAVKWFQIKEGIKPTGEIDTPTLQALQKVSKANLAVIPGVDPAPGSVRERSRQLAESDQNFLESVETFDPRPPPSPPAVERRPAPPPPPEIERRPPAPAPESERRPPPSEPELERRPPAPEVERRPPAPAPEVERRPPPGTSPQGGFREPSPQTSVITEEDAQRFVEDYLQAAEAPSPENEISFYADQVDYFDSGRVDRQFITRDQKNYYRRWPIRDFTLLADPQLESASSTEAALRFRIRYSLRGGDATARGQTENFLRLKRSEAGLKIIGIRERKIRQ